MAATWTTRESAAGSNKRTLLISLVFGLVSAFLVYRLVAGAQGKSSGGGATVPVLVAQRDIPAKTVVTSDMVAVRQVTPSMRVATAYTDTKGAVGRVARSPISAGEQLLTTKLADSVKDVGFAGQVPQGMRAVSVTSAEVVSDGGLVQPGDYVDVVAVFQEVDPTRIDADTVLIRKDEKAQRLVAETVLQDVQVLAVAQQATDPVVNGKSNGKPNADAKSITLAVAPEDVERLFLADHAGTLRLALHHLGDHDNQPLPSLNNNVNDVFGAANAGKPAPAVQPAQPQATPQPGSATR